MPYYQYVNNRAIAQSNSFLDNFRGSALTRIFKGSFEYSFLQAALTYGITYSGFGIHSYYLDRTNPAVTLKPWERMLTLGHSFGKYLLIALPFFCTC